MARVFFIAILTFVVLAPAGARSSSEADTEAFFERREASLRRDDGWLSLIGLFALAEGSQSIGCGAATDLRLPPPHPTRVGTLTLGPEGVRFRAADDVEAMVGEEPITKVLMQPDVEGSPTIVEVGSLLFYVIVRNERPYLRVKDREAALLSTFEGIERWDYDPALCVEARFVAHESPHVLHVSDVLGGGENLECDGAFEFEIGGVAYRLEATGRSDTRWSFIYGDASNGDETYGGGRYLYFDAPDDEGRVVLDFNQSYNPPCVFTAYSTCLLPPATNVLPIAIRAGEKTWSGAH